MALRWSEFKSAAPAIAAVGESLLYNPTQGEVAILATIDRFGLPNVAPFCPIFTAAGVYLLAGANTPKVRHLNRNPAFAIHALVGADDLEFQMRGVVRPVIEPDEQAEVLSAVPFAEFDATDPVFELLAEHALAVTWPTPGQAEKQVWHLV